MKTNESHFRVELTKEQFIEMLGKGVHACSSMSSSIRFKEPKILILERDSVVYEDDNVKMSFGSVRDSYFHRKPDGSQIWSQNRRNEIITFTLVHEGLDFSDLYN